MFSPKIFKAYDIRGTSPGEIDEEVAFRVGQAVVEELDAHSVVVGEDMRKTSRPLADALVQGITSRGADAVRIGLATTPMFYFAVAAEPEYDAGVMVTASHNPAQYNGFKIVRGDAMPVGAGSGMEQIRDRVLAGRLPEEGGGSVTESAVMDAYLDRLASLLPFGDVRPMTIAVDAGNGMAGAVLPVLFERLPQVSVHPLYFDLDGAFPHHEANPLKVETLRDLQVMTRDKRAALGVAYDGDGDRVGFVDERGVPIRPDLILALLAREVLAERPGATVLYDVRCGRATSEEIAAAGGKPVITRVGHAFIKRHLRETGAVFAGELSAHYYFRDFFGVECSDLAMLMLIRMISREGRPLSELVAPLLRYAHSGEINFEVAEADAAMRRLRERYAVRGARVSDIDGVRIDLDDWWFNVRPSNTEPLLRLNLEARTTGLMEEKREELRKLLS